MADLIENKRLQLIAEFGPIPCEYVMNQAKYCLASTLKNNRFDEDQCTREIANFRDCCSAKNSVLCKTAALGTKHELPTHRFGGSVTPVAQARWEQRHYNRQYVEPGEFKAGKL